ncbi:hypothetical protein D3C80_1611770 [compost metagenome]
MGHVDCQPVPVDRLQLIVVATPGVGTCERCARPVIACGLWRDDPVCVQPGIDPAGLPDAAQTAADHPVHGQCRGGLFHEPVRRND